MGSNRTMPMPAPNVAPKVESQVQAEDNRELIKVVAIRRGWYGNRRYKDGDEFIVDGFKNLGQWMRCINKNIQAKHEKTIREKKKRQRLAAAE